MNKPIIEVKSLSKKYTLGERQPYYSFRDTISGVFHTPFKKEKLEKDEFWALKDVSFDIYQGDVVGVIGRNGAGKSTLLKILSQITPPTEGEVKLKGRVASLLEVGTGFHPELTGRENIYLNGAILGMKRWEINKKFKEIVDFSEIEKFLDTPVKHYSSGMYMRLAFSVAAHLEPEILIIDEVLAVGDAQFQKKCLGKMSEVSKQGRTVIFVSHNISAVKQLCKKTILLDNGTIKYYGNTEIAIEKYINTNKALFNQVDIRNKLKRLPNDPIFELIDIYLKQKGKNIDNYRVNNGDNLEIIIVYNIKDNINNLRLYVDLCNENDELIFRSYDDDLHSDTKTQSGKYKSKVVIPKGILGPTKYQLKINSGIFNERDCIPYGEISFGISVENTSGYSDLYPNNTFYGQLALLLKWSNIKETENENKIN